VTDTPSKAAIERACELLSAEEAFGAVWDPRTTAGRHPVRTLARHLDQVSETAKAAVQRSIDVGDLPSTRTDLAKLILPDPEPDVLAEAMSASIEFWDNHTNQPDPFGTAVNIVRTELRKRGYAITPLKDEEA